MSTKERLLEAYVHYGRVAVLVDFSLDDPITTLTNEFKQLARDLAMHIAAAEPKDLEGLLLQPFVKDASVTVAQHISAASQHLHEDISVARFVRWDTKFQPPESGPTPPDWPAVAMKLKNVK